MRYWYYLLFSLVVVSAHGQYMYVQSWQEGVGGWIVSPEGETIYEIPAGWRPEEHHAPMAEIESWPVLMRWQKSGKKSRFAFLTKDLQWQDISGYFTVSTLGENRFRGLSSDRNHVTLLNGEGKQISRDTFSIIQTFDLDAVAVANMSTATKKAKFGLIDTLGQWIIPPLFDRLHNMRQGRFLGYDSLGHQYLLRAQYRTLKWDTLLNLQQKNWWMNSIWTYDTTGHSWVKLSDGHYHPINLQGKLLGDTVKAFRVHPFSEGIGMVNSSNSYRYVDQEGRFLNTISYPSAKDYDESLALVEDPHSNYFGYLNRNGEWAIEPNYCYATSFRGGWAVVAPAIPENCSTLRRERGGDRHIPPSLHHTRVIRDYQLIDTIGKVIWADSCRELYLPAKGVLGVNYSYNQLSPAVMIKWLRENRSWISPNFTVTRWAQLDSLTTHTIKRINFGVRRFDQLYDQIFDLPDDFIERLSSESLQQLEELNLDAHRLSPAALEAVFALPHLRKLSLGYNDLEALPVSVKQLDQLEVLDLSGTQFTSLPKSVYRMRHLQKLIIINTALPAETIPRLRKALPNTEIVFKYEW
jgi:hypothetical protein